MEVESVEFQEKYTLAEGWIEKAYVDHSRKLLRWLYHFLGDADEAENILQDVFVSLCQRESPPEIHTSVESYLFKAVKFQTMKYIRDKVTKEKHHEQIRQTLPVGDATTEKMVAFRELDHRIEQEVLQLPPQCQKVYRMSREQGMSISDIADTVQISQSAVKQHLHKAIASLKSAFADYEV